MSGPTAQDVLAGDPGAKDPYAQAGRYPSTTAPRGSGPGHQLIQRDKAKPSFIVSHELSLREAPSAYQNVDDRLEGWTKVLLKPAA